jgi:hypothetical protein
VGGWPTQEDEKHYGKKYANVWTKEPHGGKYKLVGNKGGYDALECDSSGALMVREPGKSTPLSLSPKRLAAACACAGWVPGCTHQLDACGDAGRAWTLTRPSRGEVSGLEGGTSSIGCQQLL